MIELCSIYQYPLTGARSVELETGMFNAAGLVGDRPFVLYDAAKDPTCERNRLSQRQYPQLAQVTARLEDDQLLLEHPDFFLNTPLVFKNSDCQINEFDDVAFEDITPGIDCGDQAATVFRRFLGHASVRLAQKSPGWLAGEGIAPANRIVAPIHIVAADSVAELQSRAPEASFGVSRFRPTLLVDSIEESFTENNWVGKVLSIGNLNIGITRNTKRCMVTGIDQQTGENKKDVPKLFRGLAKSADDKKPIFGVYGYPLLQHSETANISVGDRGTLIS